MSGPRPTLTSVGWRLLASLGSTLLTLALLELALTAWYTGLAGRGPYEIARDWGSPYVFQRRSDLGDGLGLRRSAATCRASDRTA